MSEARAPGEISLAIVVGIELQDLVQVEYRFGKECECEAPSLLKVPLRSAHPAHSQYTQAQKPSASAPRKQMLSHEHLVQARSDRPAAHFDPAPQPRRRAYAPFSVGGPDEERRCMGAAPA